MESFIYFFGLNIGGLVLIYGDNLSPTLQNRNISAMDGQQKAFMTIKTFKQMLINEQFILFWKIAQEKAYGLDISYSENSQEI